MTTARDEARDKYLNGIVRGERLMARHGFESGWHARDAEVERLRAACKAAITTLKNAVRAGLDHFDASEIESIANEHATVKQLRDALKEDAK